MCNSGTVAASLLNKPTSVVQAFRLQVLPLPNVGADYAEQTLYELSNGGVYRRICVGTSGWNAWQKFTITAD